MELRSIADRELIRLEKDARLMRIVYPRLLLLKGDSLYLSGRYNTADTIFNQVSSGQFIEIAMLAMFPLHYEKNNKKFGLSFTSV